MVALMASTEDRHVAGVADLPTTLQRSWVRPSRYGALWSTAIVLPLVGTIFSSLGFYYLAEVHALGDRVSYLLNLPYAVGLGLGAAAIAWGVAASIYSRRTLPATANAQSYRELVTRLDVAQVLIDDLERVEPVEADRSALDVGGNMARHLALDEARRHIAAIRHALGIGGPPTAARISNPSWTSGDAYLEVWLYLHRAEEALLKVRPLPEVLANVERDRLRLAGSPIASRDDLIALLDQSRVALSSVQAPPVSPPGPSSPQRSPDPPAPPAMRSLSYSEALETVSMVHRAINEFADDRRSSLLQLRNMLHTGGVLSALIAFALFLAVSAIGQGNDGYAAGPLTACILFGVGALGGTFLSLYNDMQRQTGTFDEINLLGARLTLTPVVAGLSAIGAVFVMGSLTQFGVHLYQGKGLVPTAPGEIFNFGTNAWSVLYALLAGMFPEYFIRRLPGLTDRIMSQLDAVSPTSVQPPKPSDPPPDTAAPITASTPPSGPG